MTERPDFSRMTTEAAILILAESFYYFRARLEGNGQPGLCQVRGIEIGKMGERIAVIEASTITAEDLRQHQEAVESLRVKVAQVEVNTQSTEVEKLRARTGKLEDFRAWAKGAGATAYGLLMILAALVGALFARGH
jgi:ABC-type Zn uptake system ZnuABC Zn-binding protein ZnuA